MGKGMWVKIVMALSVVMVLMSLSPTFAAEVIQWKWQDLYTTAKPVPPWDAWGTSLFPIGWINWVEKATNGRLIVKRHEMGSLVSAAESLKAVGAGMVDGLGCGFAGYWTGTIPEADVEIGLPMAWTNSSESYYSYYRMGMLKEMRNVYAKHNVYYMAPFALNAAHYSFGTTFPINSINDLKGKKIRAVGMAGELVKALGGAPVVLPPPEIYMALKLGTIDGVIWDIMGLEEYKLKEVLKYYVASPNLNAVVCNFVVNMGKWNALPQDIKDIIERDTPNILMKIGADFYMQEKLIAANAEKEYGVKLVYWSDKDVETINDICIRQLWPKVAAKSPNCAKLVDMVTSQAKLFGKIK